VIGALRRSSSGTFTGLANVGVGASVMPALTSGNVNTAAGFVPLNSDATGDDNAATGWRALMNATGHSNLALGLHAGEDLTTGSNNIYIATWARPGTRR